ncbi:hypothetical protein PHYSODRAFT_333416 [Phytophthora sojae]|uniref:Uncharacterized protein n=1 Tax=Phytophthora sojae (strain P6497) TaxID=1094619 RepID=G4ZPA6_PHYSP|nr:hypothetical protein PHYSODRAFT_333416 [Phytophthora sojae]EGZ15146.1 hypothetical protein PHYSODRAFT_333416 [Phytophthora sojae]|eukprot:XP_009528895.1 hypothetical protein PHYSODRAFT_333416 [Phytophthora sojae]
MRCHRGFWAYAGEASAEISDSAARFARKQAAQDAPGANEAAQDWLRTRAGRGLRSLWLAEEPPRRQTYILNNADDTFPLEDYPKGIVDGRKDHVSTPQVVHEASAAVQAGNSSNDQDSTVDKALDTYRGELVRTALAAEVTALARAIRGGAIEDVVSQAAAIVECMGAQIASELYPSARAEEERSSGDVDNECHNEASASDEVNSENHDDASASGNGSNEYVDEKRRCGQ